MKMEEKFRETIVKLDESYYNNSHMTSHHQKTRNNVPTELDWLASTFETSFEYDMRNVG